MIDAMEKVGMVTIAGVQYGNGGITQIPPQGISDFKGPEPKA